MNKIKDIARLANTSVATVSRVINGDPNVSEALKKRVYDVIEETGYVPNFVGRNLRTSKSYKLLVILPDIANQFYSEILKGIEEQAGHCGYDVLTSITHLNTEIETRYLDMVKTRQVDGIISFYTAMDSEKIRELARTYPYVQACEPDMAAESSYVMIDNEKAAYDAVTYLIEKGYQSIGMISGTFYRNSENARETGYRRALQTAGLAFCSDNIKHASYDYATGYAECTRLLEQKEPVTAVFSVSDVVAAGAVRSVLDHGLVPGKDVGVIGFDNTSLSETYNPSITTVAQPRHDIGTIAVDLLMEKINDIHAISKGIVLPHHIVYRQSTGDCAE